MKHLHLLLIDRRLMMIIGDGGSVLGLVAIILVLSTPSPRLAHILAGVAASSCLAALTEPALRASVTDLVDEEDYLRSAGMLQAASSARYLLSPLLAGLLLPLVGLRGLLALDASTCLVTVTCSIIVMRAVGRRSAGERGAASPADHLLGGWRAVTARPGVRGLVALMTFVTLTIGKCSSSPSCSPTWARPPWARWRPRRPPASSPAPAW